MAGGNEVGQDINLFDFSVFHQNPAELNDLVEVHGTGCELRRSVQCPCVRIETGTPRVRCKQCRGLGWVYPEHRREAMIVLVLSRQPQAKDRPAGWFDDGTIVGIFPNGYVPARGDIVLPDQDVVIVQQVLRRGVREIDCAAVMAREQVFDARTPAVQSQDDTLLYSEGIEIEDVYWIRYQDTDDEQLVRGFLDVDWRLAPGGVIVWLGDHKPPAGAGYSVRYRAPAAYLVMSSAPVLRSEGGIPFPWKATMGRLDKLSKDDLR